MTRPVLLLAAAALLASFAPAAQASGCTPPWYERETGFYSPLTGQPITYCEYRPRG
ncbi:MAG TPA: hypothetical protein VNA20_04775 [Frankiaceae bacterium]|nr:hypothetical protein [Frankiaceae bacterium]